MGGGVEQHGLLGHHVVAYLHHALIERIRRDAVHRFPRAGKFFLRQRYFFLQSVGQKRGRQLMRRADGNILFQTSGQGVERATEVIAVAVTHQAHDGRVQIQRILPKLGLYPHVKARRAGEAGDVAING